MKLAVLLCCLLGIALVLPLALAEEGNCGISSADSDEFSFEIVSKENKEGRIRLFFRIPYSRQCIEEQGLEAIMQAPAECEKAMISDAVFHALGFFVISSKCLLSYEEETGHLLVETTSITENIAIESNGFHEIKFDKWNLIPHKPGTKNDLKIILPASSRIVSYYPQKGSEKGGNYIFWEEIPEEAVSVKYVLPVPPERNAFFIGGVVLVIALAGLFVLSKVKRVRELKEEQEELSEDEQTIRKEMKKAQHSYLKRRIDEETFKKMVEQSELKLNKVRAKKELVAREKAKAEGKSRKEIVAREKAKAEGKAKKEVVGKEKAGTEGKAKKEVVGKEKAKAEGKAEKNGQGRE